ncbi:hypothetical protein Glove_275g103 [Diversispora epigaea]|uniref:SAP domain-containing protein n=1 Tax=Diversispora epigaea TaxID=1348612 RepID=A0A397IBD0_9GLOM|nr:hypothetical protein Glove_275g103 [Diversispora epigaea]
MNRRSNQGRLYFLLGFVEQSNYLNYYYIKKYLQSKIIIDYNEEPVELEKDNIDYLKPMTEQLAKNCNVELRDGYYITNIVTGECPLCLDYIWNGPFHDVCKHCPARIFSKAQVNNSNVIEETKKNFANYFKNKERVVPPNQKNNIIYLRSTDEAYEEIICLFNIEGTKIFYSPIKQSNVCIDSFGPIEFHQQEKEKQINHYKETINSDPKKSKINSIATVTDLSFIETRQINSESTIIDPEIQFTTQELEPVTNLQSQYKTNDPEFDKNYILHVNIIPSNTNNWDLRKWSIKKLKKELTSRNICFDAKMGRNELINLLKQKMCEGSRFIEDYDEDFSKMDINK